MDACEFSLCGVGLRVECQAPHQLTLISKQWQRFFVLEYGGGAPATVFYSFQVPDSAADLPLSGVEVSRSANLLVLKTESGFYLRSGSSYLDIDVAGGRCQGVLSDAFWQLPLEYQREFFLLNFLMILRPLGLYGLHANGLLHNGTGYLVVGSSGSGKTTLALALVREGWGFLSDDALMLHETTKGIEALPLRRGFSCTEQTASHFPEIRESIEEAPAFLDGKKLIDIGHEYPGSFRSSAVPGVLFFPTISNNSRSKLLPVDATEAVVGLLEQSPGIMIEKQWVTRQMKVLSLLANQSRCYRLNLGSDIYENPQAISELLASVPTQDRHTHMANPAIDKAEE